MHSSDKGRVMGGAVDARDSLLSGGAAGEVGQVVDA